MGRLRLAGIVVALGLALGCEGARAPASDAQLVRLGPATLAPFAARVESARGLRFVRAVSGWRVSPSALPGVLARELDRAATSAEIARDAELATSLGLLPPHFDLRSAVLAFQVESAAGFYSPLRDRFYLVDGGASAGAESRDALFVHELTHALQAQHAALFDAILGIRGDDDLLFALTALLEGEATFVELSDAAQRAGAARPTPAEFAARFPSAAVAPQLPRAVAEAFVAPYPLGYALVDALVARGGLAALDAAHADPPLTSAALLHPERHLPAAHAPLTELARAPRLAGCRALASTCYGELTVRVWLEELGAGALPAARAADGWDADRAWRFDCAGAAASAWLIALGSEAEASELAELLLALAPRAGGDPLAIAQQDARVLASRGLGDEAARALLELPAPRRFASLAQYLAAHPDVGERARRLRR
jgi:hypothetical protein